MVQDDSPEKLAGEVRRICGHELGVAVPVARDVSRVEEDVDSVENVETVLLDVIVRLFFPKGDDNLWIEQRATSATRPTTTI